MRLDRDAIATLASRLPRGSAVVSATNGKTTTAAMAASILNAAGVRVVHNRAGANMASGVASTLLDAATGDGIDGDLGLFEVDEFWLDRVVDELAPSVLVLGNLFRDQLDRYGELDAIADRWAGLIAARPAGEMALVLNADDPLIADLGRDRGRVTFFGVEDRDIAQTTLAHAADSKHCRSCGGPYRYDAIYLGHLGDYHCPSCGAKRPQPSITASRVALEGVRAARFELHTPVGSAAVRLPVPGLYNVYNALAASGLALAQGVALVDVVAGLEAMAPAFGRAETVRIADRELSILLVKNPAGTNEVVRTLALEPGDHDILGVLNDQTADGRDVSWIWDADFEPLAARVRRATCSGTRAAELAVRLKYAGVPAERIAVEPALDRALDRALADDGGANEPLYALPTYTAMLALRELLGARGHVTSSWGER